ncbi:MAG: hypothetical protein ACE5GR_00530 [Nitrosopumilus sp.]
MNIPIIKLKKSQECYECESKKQKGTKFYCKRCKESHFVCVNCIPVYLKKEKSEFENSFKIDNALEGLANSIQDRIELDSDFSKSTKKEFQ